jgi:hypothetical protein
MAVIILAGIAAFVGSLLTASIASAIFAAERVRSRRRAAGRPHAL